MLVQVLHTLRHTLRFCASLVVWHYICHSQFIPCYISWCVLFCSQQPIGWVHSPKMTWWRVETCWSEVKISWNIEMVRLIGYNIAISTATDIYWPTFRNSLWSSFRGSGENGIIFNDKYPTVEAFKESRLLTSEGLWLLKCDILQFGRNVPAFQSLLLPQCSFGM
jgi:hypothetical protein